MQRGEIKQGIGLAVTAYTLWGLSPIFWRLGDGSAGAALVVRIVSTFVLLGLVQVVRDRGVGVRAIARDRRTVLLAATSATLLAGNWLVFIWAVNNERVLEASLGYFLNPLVSVVLGVSVLGERLRANQWLAVSIAAVGVVVLSIDVRSHHRAHPRGRSTSAHHGYRFAHPPRSDRQLKAHCLRDEGLRLPNQVSSRTAQCARESKTQ